jgi:hypothetical protein
MKTKIYLVLFLSVFARNVFADDSGLKWSELRVFTMTNTLSTTPAALNNITASDNVEQLDTLYGIGLEADAKWRFLKIGTRVKGILMSKNPPNPPSPAVSYLTVGQYSGGLLARVPVIDNDTVNFDFLAEVGAANTSLEIATASNGKGEFKCEACVFGRVGASINLGWPTFKFSLEGGQEFNNLSSLKYSGTLTNHNVDSVDLSGPYVAAGVIIYGLPSWIKPGGITVGK